MLRNYLLIFIRNVVRSPLYFALNALGIAIGVTSCLILNHYVNYESTYDRHHTNVDRKYRMLVADNEGTGAQTPAPVQQLLEQGLPQIKNAVAIRPQSGVLNSGSLSSVESNIVYSSPHFFEMFSYDFIVGSPNQLENRTALYLSESMAMKYFKTLDILGQKITFFDRNFGQLDYEVAGIFKDGSNPSHLLVDAVLSMKSLEGSNNFWATFDNWGWGEFYTYVELNDDTQFSSTDSKQFLDKHIGEENRKRAGLELIAQPIASIHTTTGILNEISPTRDQRILDFLQLIAAIIVFLAAINYVNLSTAKGIKRAKEVGIRKNLGATRGALTAQFALESMALNLLALAFAVTIIQIIQPWLINGIGEAFESSVFASDSSVYLSLIPIAIALLWSTFQPALVISNFSVIKVMKGKVSDNGNGKFYRNVSVGIQFAVSLILMITTYVIYEQIRYFQNYNLGINIDQKIIVNKPKEQVDNYLEKAITFRNSLESLAAVQNVSASGSVPAHGFNWATNSMRRVDKPAERVGEYGINVTYIDEEYVEIYQPEVLLGSTSINDFSNEKKAVINESALNPLEIESLEQAIGMKVTNDGKDEFEIIGVIKNYQHTSLLMESRPAIFIFENNPQYFTIQYNLGNQGLARTNQLITDINKLYNAAFGSVNFEYAFLDEKFAEEYRYESFLANIIISFTGVSILLAGMGLFGLSFFNMERKTKEVGIRKTLGASTVSLFKVNFTPIFKLFIMASIFAIPLAMLISTKWLEDYTNKIDLNIIYFIIPAGILLVVMLFTVSYHLLKLNNVNPVESLRYE